MNSTLTGRRYVDDQEKVVLQHRMIILHYLGGWFLIDFLSAIPLGPIQLWPI